MQPQAPAYNPQAQTPRPYARFEYRPVEDRTSGQPQFVDKAWVILMAPGSRDTVEQLAEDWIAKLHQQARDGRVPQNWPQEYKEALQQWEKTQEQPTTGRSLKNWPPLSPAQLKNCLSANILTVEDLAQANDQALARIGMGALGLKQMAQTWLKDQASSGALASKVQTLQNALEAATRRVTELEGLLPEKYPKSPK